MDEYGKFLFAHVMDRPFLYYWALETKKDRYDLFRYTGESAKEAEELARPLSKNSRGWFDVLGHPNRGLQSTRKPHFAGRVAILVDGGSFSATGETTSAFHYYKKAVFFGEECGSGYYGNTSGFMVTATLPATRLQVRVPLVLYTMAVDGYPKDRGIVPDFPVTPTVEDLLAGRDVSWSGPWRTFRSRGGLVPRAGLEPARPCGRDILSVVRMPIPPPGRGDGPIICRRSAFRQRGNGPRPAAAASVRRP